MSFINPAQTVQDLRNAVEYLTEHPWIQGTDFDFNGGCCANGALRAVVGDIGASHSIFTQQRMSNAGRAFYRVIGQDITKFNDATERTKNEVVAALTLAADTIEKDPSRA